MAGPTIGDTYASHLAARRASLEACERRHVLLSRARLAVVAGALAIVIAGGWGAAPWLVVPVLLFVAAAIVHARVLSARVRSHAAVVFYERGLARMRHEWIGAGEPGDRFRPAEHLYADDLDLFGRGSLYELLATARTRAGEEVLARWILTPSSPEEIGRRQASVRELIPRLDLREALAVTGDGLPRAGIDTTTIRGWAAAPPLLRSRVPQWAMIFGSLLTAPLLVSLAVSETLPRAPARVLFAILAVQGLFVLTMRSRVAPAIHAVDTPARDLELFAGVLALFERESFVSQRLEELTSALRHSSRVASREIGWLDQMVALLASRTNIIVALPAALVYWGTQMAFAIDRWRVRLSPDIPRWLDAVGELDALLALATYAAEHPDHAFPDVVDGTPAVEATALAHPLLSSAAVPNDVAVGGLAPHLIVVSGSNMSGKSTLLRALGLNVVLAQAGAPVRASRMRLSPLAVGASIRVLDSLMDGRSRFYAEITRLKHVVNLVGARSGHVLFLFDEILSGTNSHDRQHGADALLSGLLARGAIGLVTTHDLALGQIADRLAPRAANMHFEDRFEGGSMSFDYRLRAGIVRTSNAVPLMRSIGLDV